MELFRNLLQRKPRNTPLPIITRIAVGVELFISVGAVFGGGQFMMAPDGHLIGISVNVLVNSPFSSFFIPGLVLFAFIGLGPIAAAILSYRRPAVAPIAAAIVGFILTGWVTVEMVMLAGPTSLLWAVYLVLGAGLASLGLASSMATSGRATLSAPPA